MDTKELFPDARFQMGQLVTTPGALGALVSIEIFDLLTRHSRGDWGIVDEFDRKANDIAMDNDLRLLSAYDVRGQRIWVITEADRSCTTVLLPEEY